MKRNCVPTSKRKNDSGYSNNFNCFDETEKRKTKTSSAVKNRYNNRVYGSIIVRIPKEMAEAFKEKCAVTGTAQAQVIKKAIEQFLAE